MQLFLWRFLINLWPPFLFAGIRCTYVARDFRRIDVAMHSYWLNLNIMRTHFGGSLYAMTDPWYMAMLMQILGRDYYVWDRRAEIDFEAPGRGTVRARFSLDQAQIDAIRVATADGDKHLAEFDVEIRDAQNKRVALVKKTVYVRKKPEHRAAKEGSAAPL
ncbi:hotdog fold domain-containing protein [Silvimonas sp. JCM 19000]